MEDEIRNQFDGELAKIIAELPDWVRQRIDETPIYVEDQPSAETMRRLGVGHPDHLCGLFTGVALTERSVNQPYRMPDTVTLFRRGILSMGRARSGRLDWDEARRQIRITLLHELGHLHGLDEDDLAELGYD